MKEKQSYDNKRIILVGKSAAGKDFLKKRFKERGFKIDISYTTRPIREGEVDGETYHYLTEKEFNAKIANIDFYEFQQHGDYWYGTGQKEWDECDVFIMETDGISDIELEDREKCFIIYLNPPEEVRKQRLREIRGWDDETINHRANTDNQKFKNFTDYDMVITNPDF